MTLRNFWGLVRERAWKLADERSRKSGFWVAPTSTIVPLLAWLALPEGWPPLLAKLLPYASLASFIFLVLDFLRLFLIRTPYELYREKSEALEAALPAKMAAARRAEIHDVLAAFLELGQNLIVQLQHFINNARGPRRPDTSDMDIGYQAIQWIEDVEGYMIRELDLTYRVRFAWDAYFPPVETLGIERDRIQYGLKARVANLLVIVGEFRARP